MSTPHHLGNHETDSKQGQTRIHSTSVLIVGAGGLGCPAAAYLAGAGFKAIGLVDGDTCLLYTSDAADDEDRGTFTGRSNNKKELKGRLQQMSISQ